ncbi:MAG: OmpA family protein [Bacteroidaceae bacterium]|nr:OmpA family protein [Bacteroidaceae bacterium]
MKKLLLLALMVSICGFCNAQQTTENKSTLDNWYVGIGGGLHWSILDYSNLDKSIYPESNFMTRGVFTMFGQYEFGKEKQFALRGELSFLRRGGELSNIQQSLLNSSITGFDKTSDISYTLKSGYCDIRVSFIYNLLKETSHFHPYVFITPILGFSTGGNIHYKEVSLEGDVFDYEMPINKGNFAPVYFAGAIGAGCRYQFDIKDNLFFVGLEIGYEYGLTDTYSALEKNGEAEIDNRYFANKNTAVEGSRKFHNIELKATVGVPLTIFKKKVKAPVVEEKPIPMPVVVEEKPCYTLDEITDMITRGERVEGKTICAIDDITFEFGKSTIKADSYTYLNRLANILIRIDAQVEVKGHTDNIGSEEFNLNLSKERAYTVVQYLISKGVKTDKISYSYYGLSQPLTDNDTEEGRRLNRRVEFEIQY